MPYSDHPPPMVVPDTRAGRAWAAQNASDELHVVRCDRYRKPGSGWVARHPEDVAIPKELGPCGARESGGVRFYNWCFRCMSGFPLTGFDTEREAETGVETAVRL